MGIGIGFCVGVGVVGEFGIDVGFGGEKIEGGWVGYGVGAGVPGPTMMVGG